MSRRRNPIARMLRDLGGGVHKRSRSGERQLLDHELESQIERWYQEDQQRREIDSGTTRSDGELG